METHEMKVRTLQEAVADSTQQQVAQQIGVNQSAVSQMLRSGRRILVLVDSVGRIERAWEEREVGQRRTGIKISA